MPLILCAPKRQIQILTQEPVDVILVGNRDFAAYWIRESSNSMTGVIRRGKEDVQTDTQREECSVYTE
jgi:hypothetical protein